ncbi:unnamed protein product [Phytomonas sp. EM1]|nr:unnamed protein product [Phytomonas sp. EM1]|eukprot:CCW62164.1 unnamed protein product [Phytomonas sp. isolate EM1]
MAENVEEWADSAADFFEEFTQNTKSSTGKSLRKRNRESKEGDALQALLESEKTREARAAESRRRIAAVVVSRASPKEIKKAVESVKKHDRVDGKVRNQNEMSRDTFHSKSRRVGRHAANLGKPAGLKTGIRDTGSLSKSSKPFIGKKGKQRKPFFRGKK